MDSDVEEPNGFIFLNPTVDTHLVTEPSEFGLHDLKIAIELVKMFQIPFGIIINKDDGSDNIVKEYLRKSDPTILGTIPYSKEAASMYSKGSLLCDNANHRTIFREIAKNIIMRIAVASDGKSVSGHFGHCEGFIIYDLVNKAIKEKQFVPNPGHRPGFLPAFLKQHGVNAIIAGGMGSTAQELFRENQIDVFVGVEGFADAAVDQFAKGLLKSTGSICEEHSYEGHCND